MAIGSAKFKAVGKGNPCPVCGGKHKCSLGNDGLILCGRRDEEQPGFVHLGAAKKDPQFHLYRRVDDPVLQERAREKTHKSNGQALGWQQLAAEYQVALTPARRDELAADLGILADALGVLQVG
jgi:hypothetical protein